MIVSDAQGHCYIGLDAGTTVIKSVLFDSAGEELFVVQESVPIETPQPGFQEQDMNRVWDAAKTTIGKVVRESGVSAELIKAIGVTGQGAGCWLIDEWGNPVRNAILWLDGRAVDIIENWEKSGIAEAVYKICGSIQYAGCQSAIIKWLSINEPATLQAARYTLWCKDWIKFKLTGVVATDPSDSSVSFLDITKWEYDAKLTGLMGIDRYSHLLPPVQSCRQVTGSIIPELADELGLSRKVQVVGAPFDMSAAAVGVGAVSHGEACSILGTALISEVTLEEPAIEPLNVGFTLCHGDSGRWLRAMAGMMGSPNLDWFLNNFCHEDKKAAADAGQSIFDYCEERIARLPIGSDGIVYHSYLSPAGERSPFFNENVKAQFTGLSQEHTRHHLLRAVYEGVALAMKHSYDTIPGSLEQVSLSGGGAKSPLWCQIIADALGATVRVPVGTEFGARGAVMNAMVALGVIDSYESAVKRFVRFNRKYSPNMDNHGRYQQLYQVYLQIYAGMLKPWNRLASYKKQI